MAVSKSFSKKPHTLGGAEFVARSGIRNELVLLGFSNPFCPFYWLDYFTAEGIIMGMIRGKREFEKWKCGKPLSRKEAIIAQCYECNGEEEGAVDCRGQKTCPLYQYFPYRVKTENVTKRKMPEKAKEALRRYQADKKNATFGLETKQNISAQDAQTGVSNG